METKIKLDLETLKFAYVLVAIVASNEIQHKRNTTIAEIKEISFKEYSNEELYEIMTNSFISFFFQWGCMESEKHNVELYEFRLNSNITGKNIFD